MKRTVLLRSLLLVWSVVLAAALFCACRPKEDNGPRASITAWEMTAADGAVTLKLSGSVASEEIAGGIVTVTLTDVKGEIDRAEIDHLPETPEEVRLECSPGRLWDELTVLVSYTLEGKEYGRAELKLIDRLPQLTHDGVKCVVHAMSAREKANLVMGEPNPAKPGSSGGTFSLDHYGIPTITVNDGPAGVRYGYAVWYPSMMNLASSWDTDRIYEVGKAIGEDSLAQGIDIVLGPGMNIHKNVLGGRNFEYFSEDPLVTALAASGYVRGLQSTGAGACLKHFCVNNQETWRGTVSSEVTERALREIYLRGFEYVVKNDDPMAVMSSYNCLNGNHTSITKDLLTGILRDEWGFRKVVMSDWGAAGSIPDKVKAGNDLDMPGSYGEMQQMLEALSEGNVDLEALDRCAEHILNTILASPTYNGVKMNHEVDHAGHSKISRKVAAETMVLFKNEGSALPLKSGTVVAAFGNGAFSTFYGGAGSGGVNPVETVNIIDGIDAASGLSVYDKAFNIFNWCEAHSETDPTKDVQVSREYAEECAQGAGAAVIVISRISMEGADNTEKEGGFLLNEREEEMIRNASEAFHAAGKKVIVVLNTGNPIEVISWRDSVDAILWCGYPGERAGEAVADVLSGKVNPSGKTVITWPLTYESTPAFRHFPGNSSKVIYYEDIYVGYRYYSTFEVGTAYPFGYGLSYTTFSYSGFSVKDNGDGTYELKVTVKNTGKAAGREVVEFYVSKPEGTLEMAAYELCGFAKTKTLKAGKSQTVTVTVTEEQLRAYDKDNSRYIVPEGEYVFYVGNACGSFADSASVNREVLTVTDDVEPRCVPRKEFEHLTKNAA